jgi:hypothetical protein
VAAAGYAAIRAYEPEGTLSNSFALAMQDLIFEPLGMRNTCVRQNAALSCHAAHPHAVDLDGRTTLIPAQLEQFCDSLQPAGGVWSTAEDLAAYLRIELNRGWHDGDQIVSEDSLLKRWTPGVRVNSSSFYGLGLFVSEDDGIRVARHPGNSFGFSAELCFFPDDDLGFVFLSNLGMAVHLRSALRNKVIELAFGKYVGRAESCIEAALKRRALVTNANTRLLKDASCTEWMEGMLGTYRSAEFGTARIVSTGTGYWIEFEEWSSAVIGYRRHDGARVLYLTTPPWFGGPFVIAASGDLIIENPNVACTFHKVAET